MSTAPSIEFGRVPPETRELPVAPRGPVDKLAREIVHAPRCNERWLRELYANFVLLRTFPRNGGYSRELEPYREYRGREEIVFSEQIFTGVTPDGIFVQLLTDQSGYHKIVRLAGPEGYQEPPVTGGGNSDEMIRATFMETRYPLVGAMVFPDDRGVLHCNIHTTYGETMPAYEIYGVLSAIDAAKVVSLPPAREHDTPDNDTLATVTDIRPHMRGGMGSAAVVGALHRASG